MELDAGEEGALTDPRSAGVARPGELVVPDELVVPEADIYLVGYGNRLPNDLTLEALAVLKRCVRVFGGPPLHAPSLGLLRMENLVERFRPDKERRETYAEFLELILDAAAETPPVAFATYGSAVVGTFVAHRILEEAPLRGLVTHVTNAPSCFDGIWADLNLDPFYGFEIWDATTFVTNDVTPNTKAHLALAQAPVFRVAGGPDVGRWTMTTSESTEVLRGHLLRFYPADHEVHYVRTAAGAMALDVESLPLAGLTHPGRNQSATLLVPGLDRPATFDFGRPALVRDQTPAE